VPGSASAALGAAIGAVATAVGSFVIFLIRRRTALHNDHLRRAFEQHLHHYEHVFVSARTVQDSLRNYVTVSSRVSQRSDPFLFQLLATVADAAQQYCRAVSWTHNPGMAYLDLGLEEQCLRARDLLLDWLATQRIHFGMMALVRRNGEVRPISLDRVTSLRAGDYEELQIESRRLVTPAPGDHRRVVRIDSAISAVIKQLKAVMAY
jgi:hypothetical protein